jgi:hypothetical protein
VKHRDSAQNGRNRDSECNGLVISSDLNSWALPLCRIGYERMDRVSEIQNLLFAEDVGK